MALIHLSKDPLDKTPIPAGHIRRFNNQIKNLCFRERQDQVYFLNVLP